MQVHIHRQPAG